MTSPGGATGTRAGSLVGSCSSTRTRTARLSLGSLPLVLSLLAIHGHIMVCQVLAFSPSATASALRRGQADTDPGMRAPVNLLPKTTTSSRTKQSAAATKVIEIEQNEEEEALYWRVDSDEFVLHDETGEKHENESSSSSTSSKKLLKFTVRGKPVPLRRHRTSRGFMYNPSAKMQMEFRQVVSDMIYPSEMPSSIEEYIQSTTSEPEPIFKEDEYLAVTLLFRLKRPKSHFVGSKPGPGRLRPTSPGRLHTTRTDVDNLAKFVLDSLNDLVYVDDRQIISLHAAKVLDSEGHCEGATEVMIRKLDEDEMETFVASMGDI
jgi:Holliday junction resolvase RusA-like endonuclease